MARIVLTGSIEHETNTFSRVRTDLDAFRRRTFLVGAAVAEGRRGSTGALRATFEAAARYGAPSRRVTGARNFPRMGG